MSEIPNEDEIHQMYDALQKDRTNWQAQFLDRRVSSESPDPFHGNSGRQPFVSALPRNNLPSFRSDYFNVGEGLQTLAPGETKVLAKKTVPAFYGGVLTGFSQFFGGDCDIAETVTWGLRIDGLVQQGLTDFVGEYSSLMLPHSIYFPLVGGASTLGESDVSIGGRIIDEETISTILFQATNNNTFSVILQGRLIGFTFPVSERNDEFQNF